MAAGGGRTSRLIAGNYDGARTGPLAKRLAVDGAMAVDGILARLGATRPSVLVSGFWRSGTTWVQECLADMIGAKTVFEPLSPLDPRRRAMLAGLADDYDSLQAAMPEPTGEGDALWCFLDAACTGRHTSNVILNCRTTPWESFRRRVVVKDVRLAFNLDGFHRRFGLPVVHVRRHPCAVVASLLAADWDWSFARVSLSRVLPAAPDRDAVIADCDDDALSRIAAWWAVTERHAAAALEGRPWARVAIFEALAADPEPAFDGLCASIGLSRRGRARFGRPSASTVGGAAPPDRWRRSLTAEQITRVEAVVSRIYPDGLQPWGRVAG